MGEHGHTRVGGDVDAVLQKFRANGGRVTTARREIVSVVLGGTAHEHLTADEIGRRIQADHPEIALSTVYRSLEALTGLGVLEHVHMGHGPSVYHLVEDAHVHLLCIRCGAVGEIDPTALDPLAAEVERRTGFVMEPLHSAITGTCAQCATSSP